MRGVHAEMTAYFLEVHGVDAVVGGALDFCEPALEAQKAHAAALKALGLEAGKAVCDAPRRIAKSPSRGRAQIEGQNRLECHGGPCSDAPTHIDVVFYIPSITRTRETSIIGKQRRAVSCVSRVSESEFF